MKALLRLHILLLFLNFNFISNAHTLFNSGKTEYVILVSNDASISEKYAASELQYWLKEISGVTFPIVNDSRLVKKKRIIVGYIPEILKYHKKHRPVDADQGFEYGNLGDDIYIIGGKDNGTLYGVYSFLENELSCRWYTKDVSLAPKRAKWSFTELYDKEIPAFEYRNVYYYDALNTDWSLRNKNNGVYFIKKTAQGSFPITTNAIWGTHTFNILMPPEKYFDLHPEYFSLRDGKRIKGQLCLSNPSVIKLSIENLRAIIKKNPHYRVYSVTQNDISKPCQCKKCQTLVQKYGGEAGIMIWFVNQVAESLESEFPDKLICTFAYSYSRDAPTNISPRDNVLIRLCTSGCCESHSLDLCRNNVSFIKDLCQWSKHASNIYIWDYVVSFNQYLLPFPNFRTLKRNIQTYRRFNVKGVMNEGIYNTTGGDFYELRAYLLSKLLWNPDIDVEEVIDDFMKGFYQSSSSFMRSYFDKVQSLASGDVHIRHIVTDVNNIYSSEFINESLSLLSKAEKTANSEEVLDRVRRQKMVIAYLQCRKNPEQAIQDGSYDLVKNMAKKIGMKTFAEFGENKSIEDFENKMEKMKKSMNNKYSKEYLEYKLSKFLENIKI